MSVSAQTIEQDLATAVQLVMAAEPLGAILVAGLQALLTTRFGLSYAQIEAQWQANLTEATKNAGLVPPTP